MAKKGKDKKLHDEKGRTKQKVDEIRDAESIEQEFDPDVHGIPGLDELALRLSVPVAQEGEPGIVMFGKSGRAYPLVTIMGAMVQFQIEAVMHTANLVARLEGKEDDGTDQGAGQSEKGVDTPGDSQGDKS